LSPAFLGRESLRGRNVKPRMGRHAESTKGTGRGCGQCPGVRTGAAMIASIIAKVRSLVKDAGGALRISRIPKQSLAEEDRRLEAVETTRASRLICAELLKARAAAKICIEEKHWWPADLQPTSEAWQNFGRVIACEFSIKDWSAVVSGFEAVENLIKEAAQIGETPATLGGETAERIIPLLEHIERGCTALAQYLLPRSRAGRS